MKLFCKKRIKKIAIPNIAFALAGLVILLFNYNDTDNLYHYLGWLFVEVAIFLGFLEQYMLGKLSKTALYIFIAVIILTLIIMLRTAYLIFM